MSHRGLPNHPVPTPLAQLPLVPADQPFALIRREGSDLVDLLTGTVTVIDTIAHLPLRRRSLGAPASSVLAMVPYRQVRERGFEAVDDDCPLLCMNIRDEAAILVADALAQLPTDPPCLSEGQFDLDDDTYAGIVERVISEEIGRGEGANFVIHRTYTARIDGDHRAAALAAFARLLRNERGAYWTFCFSTPERTIVGATPERHISVHDGLIMMNPISGTYRHRNDGQDREGLLRFLSDPKEIDELFMVLDEELKMMASVADRGGQVIGPYLKEMAHLTHTEYLLAGRSSLDVREVLRRTMFAPTVVGSPIENACRVVARNEQRGRAYYGSVLVLLGHDGSGRQTLEAPILIRCAEFSASGQLRVPVGATLVRHSDPASEVAETHAKARGVLTALGITPAPGPLAGPAPARPRPDVRKDAGFSTDDEMMARLASRNATLARFWLEERLPDAQRPSPAPGGCRVLVVDAEDAFTGMLIHQLRSLGLEPMLRSWDEALPTGGYDLVIAGPGPGDPGDRSDPKIHTLRRVVRTALAAGQPLLGICLGHQVLSAVLGLPLIRKPSPYQGVQRTIDFFGRPERVGFYSTFSAVADTDAIGSPFGSIEIARDQRSGEVHAIRSTRFVGVQFHPESVLSEHGIDLLDELVMPLLSPCAVFP